MLYTSPLPDIVVHELDLNRFVFDSGIGPQRDDDSAVFVSAETGRTLTVAGLRRDVKRFTGALVNQLGVKRGEVVMIVSPNDIDYAVVILGAIAAGLVVTPANPAYIVDELVHQAKDSNTKYIIADYAHLATVKEVTERVHIPNEHIIVTNAWRDDGSNEPMDVVEGCATMRGLSRDAEELEPIQLTPGELATSTAVLGYSSGTTGKPKGVELTHYNIVSNISQYMAFEADWWSTLATTDVQINFLPFFHIYGLVIQLFSSIIRDTKVIVMRRFQLPQFLELIQRYRVTSAFIAPPVCLALAKHPLIDQYDLTSLREITCAAAPLGAELAIATRNRLGVIVRQGYGMTETSPITHLMQVSDMVDGSVGKMMPNLIAKIIGEHGKELSVGEIGEICVKGPNIMKGYLNRPDATAESIDADGYLHTGDIGRVDERGNFYIVDRVKEFIKYKGFQVAPAELEEILQSHEAVADAAVVPIQCPEQATELPKAYVALKPTHIGKVMEDEIVAFAAERTAHYKRLRGGVEFIDAVPRSSAGKILRRVLREKAKVELAARTTT
ncbi:hypothetical protein BDF22DRAFT_616524 [Syncephalis plumigaleata]|nr:hypothetical protein BDF22DRAFT_616524 [Syncephalis plumigaleata]